MPMNEDIHQLADQFIDLIIRMRQFAPAEAPPKAAGLSPTSMVIIDFVAHAPHCGVKEIARGLKLSAPSVSVNIRQLEDAGYISRRPHPTDKRAVQFSLTPRGQALHEQTHAFRRQKFEQLLLGLTPSERRTLLDLLEKALNQIETSHPSHHTNE